MEVMKVIAAMSVMDVIDVMDVIYVIDVMKQMDVIDVLVSICCCSVGCEGPEEQQEFDHHRPDGGGKCTTPIC